MGEKGIVFLKSYLVFLVLNYWSNFATSLNTQTCFQLQFFKEYMFYRDQVIYYNYARSSVHNGLLLLLMMNCPIDFKLGMVNPLVIKYDLERVATLCSFSECPYIQRKGDFWFWSVGSLSWVSTTNCNL